jgi:hypothetical protein
MVRPIDMADNIAKTQLTERVNQLQKAAPEMDQRQFALQLDTKHVQKREQAAPAPKTDEVVLHRDNPQQEKQKKKKKQDEHGKDENEGHLDLKA